MTVKGGTSPACAACKYQRRRCSSECILAPYFPANQTKAFQNAHRLFGVSNIMKILKQLSTEEQREEAMKSIKYEADMRERYPVYGCAGIICQLRQQLRQAIEELHYVYEQLGIYREQQFNGGNELPPNFPFMGNEYDEQLNINEGHDNFDKNLIGFEQYYNLTRNNDNSVDGIYEDFGDHMPAIIDDRQSYIENKEACESRYY
ncbi:hypothetical protein M9H77_15453 [Catharanthus roseus]|uniref:Uncharacterized protein n=1 Tax=Catharanthus roseus TaxID=4058 RepID=A0ACC0AZ84_CATRO|nr:hypothetical protein M9H77_15453 [Catharanthus roseus]